MAPEDYRGYSVQAPKAAACSHFDGRGRWGLLTRVAGYVFNCAGTQATNDCTGSARCYGRNWRVSCQGHKAWLPSLSCTCETRDTRALVNTCLSVHRAPAENTACFAQQNAFMHAKVEMNGITHAVAGLVSRLRLCITVAHKCSCRTPSPKAPEPACVDGAVLPLIQTGRVVRPSQAT